MITQSTVNENDIKKIFWGKKCNRNHSHQAARVRLLYLTF